MLTNYETNQRLTASYSDSVSSMSVTDEDNNSAQPKLEKPTNTEQQQSNVYESFDCPDCGQCFQRELQLRIHSHIHRENETPSQNTDSRNGFDEQFLLATIKSEPVEYEIDPMDPMDPMAAILDWPDTTQSDADMSMQTDDEMRWKCTICQKRFLRRAHLRAHRREHAFERTATTTTTTSANTTTTTNNTTITSIDIKVNEKKSSNKKTIPQTQKHDKSSANLLKKKLNLNVTADAAQFERWQCKKCFSTFRTRRLLRDHNVVHRNSSLASLDFDTSLLLNDSMNPNEPSIIHFDADSDAAVAAATAAAAAIDESNYNRSPPKKVTTSPKSQSTPMKNNTMSSSSSSSNETAKWKCPKCRKVFETPKQLRKHKLAAHTFEIKLNLKSKNFMSEKKSVSFSDLTASAKKRKLESRSQFVERDWPCSSCHQVFSRRSQLREHRRTAHMLKPTGALPMSISMKQEQISADEYAVAD